MASEIHRHQWHHPLDNAGLGNILPPHVLTAASSAKCSCLTEPWSIVASKFPAIRRSLIAAAHRSKTWRHRPFHWTKASFLLRLASLILAAFGLTPQSFWRIFHLMARLAQVLWSSLFQWGVFLAWCWKNVMSFESYYCCSARRRITLSWDYSPSRVWRILCW